MTTALALVILNAALLAVGLAFLFGLGLVRSRQDALRLAGLALFVGWVVTGIGLSVGLAAGLSVGFTEAAALWVAVAVASLALSRKVVSRPSAPLLGARGLPRLISIGGLAALFGWFALLLVRAAVPSGVLHVDVWVMWLPRAKAIYYFGGLDTGPSGYTSFLNPDYPPLVPALDALTFHAVGPDPLLLPLQHWVVGFAFFLGAGALLARRADPMFVWPGLAAVALAPRVGELIGSSLADEPLAMLVSLAGLCGALWLLERDARLAALCALCLVAAALAKNEGVMLSAALLAALAAATWRRAATIALIALPSLAGYLLWRVWVATHDVPPNEVYDFGKVLQPGYLVEHADRATYAGRALLTQLFAVDQWLLVTPAALIVAGLLLRSQPRLGVFVLLNLAFALGAYTLVYWTSPWDIRFYVDNTDERVVSPSAFFCGVMLGLLVSEASRSPAGASGHRARAPAVGQALTDGARRRQRGLAGSR